jgi:hypothetical protein
MVDVLSHAKLFQARPLNYPMSIYNVLHQLKSSHLQLMHALISCINITEREI